MLPWVIAAVAGAVAAAAALYAFLRLRPAINGLRAELGAMKSQIDVEFDEVKGWRNDERRLSRTLDRQQTELRAAGASLKKLETAVTSLARLEAEQKNLSSAVAAIDEAAARQPSINATRALTHRRLLSDKAVNDFMTVLAPKFGLELKERHLYHLAHRVCVLEDRCHGRLATTIDAVMTRMMAALHLTRRPDARFDFCEIGTLYGLGAIALYDAVRFNVSERRMTLIDPLDGYYGSNVRDFTSAKPVTEPVRAEPLRLAGVAPEDVAIIRAKSESPEALAATEGAEFDMLVIDGDHSYEGVMRDFENYFGRVRLGGIVVIDDYAVEEWPAIKKYADEKLLPRADVQHVFSGHRTLLLRKI